MGRSAPGDGVVSLPPGVQAQDPEPAKGRARKPPVRPWPRRAYKAALGATGISAAWSLQWTPRFLVRPLGRAVGGIAYRLSRRDRGQALANLEIALGAELDETARRNVARESFKRIGEGAVELMRAWRRPADLLARVTRVEGRHHVDAALQAGKGLVWVTGHIGNWELMAMKFAELGYPINVIATTIRYPLLNRAMIAYRMRHGVKTIERGSVSSTKEMLRAFRNNELLGVLIDHDTRVPSVVVPFFGRPARTPVGAAELSLRMGAPVVGGFIVREGREHRIVVHPPIFPPAVGRDREQTARAAAALTAEYTGLIERHVARHPADWAWTHHRWPTP